ncbi:MAG TPA: glycosyltransferase [Chloroflexota bacterium]|nr:glycosyltransferase [Chloroflexota bacterium]
MAELSQALAELGFTTHLLFIGDPSLPGHEVREGGKLHLHRWCQWISGYHPNGVYDGEEQKLSDFNESAPWFVVDQICRPAIGAGKVVAILAEEWHTVEATCRISDILYGAGLRERCLLLWNANNDFSFHRINWGRLAYVATLTTVSKYMKHLMWGIGLNPLVVPNGIPNRFLETVVRREANELRKVLADGVKGAGPFLFKIGRFDPDKRWIMAVEAAARLKDRGLPVKMLIRGGIEPHGGEVIAHAYWRGLRIQDVHATGRDTAAMLRAIAQAAPHADLLNLRSFITDEFKRVCFAAADATLANSGHEPFGIVGLEVMGAGGVVVVGSTGEDYAVSFHNCLVTETDDAEEIVGYLMHLRESPKLVSEIRREARRTAALFTWDEVIENLLGKLEYLAMTRGVAFAAPPFVSTPAPSVAELHE